MPVIVDCQSCHTRFRLDEARIPASGAKVRCSKCKTAFVVKRPEASLDERVAEVVAEATNPGASTAPPPTEDLFETSMPATQTLGGDEPEASGDEKWEFDEPPRSDAPASAGSPAAPPPAAAGAKQARPAAAAAAPAEGDDLDALGSPDEWDFLAGTRARTDGASAETPSSEAPAREAAPTVAAFDAVERAVASAAAEAPRFVASRGEGSGWSERLRDVAQTAIDSSMWIAAAALCAAGLGLALSPTAEAPAERAREVVRGSFAGHPIDLTVRRVESAVGGTLTVVRGHLPASGPTSGPTRVRARWTDAQGHPIPGDTAVVGPALPPSKLREHSLSRVRELHEARSAEIAAAGGPFEAAFGALPQGARGIALDVESAPAPEPAVTQEVTSGTEEPATASSPPTARPSSE